MSKDPRKYCPECRKKKLLSEFGKHKNRKDSLDCYCKKCRSKKTRQYYAEHPKAKKKSLERSKNWYRRNKSKQIAAQRLRNYGLTEEQRLKMYVDQDGCCAFCKKPIPYSKTDTDHNHETGKVRGLLCRGCNTRLGYVENKRFLIKALEYLDE